MLHYKPRPPHLVQEFLPFLTRVAPGKGILFWAQNKTGQLERFLWSWVGLNLKEMGRFSPASKQHSWNTHTQTRFVHGILKCNMCFLWLTGIKRSGFVLETKLSESQECLKWSRLCKMFLTPLRLTLHRCEHVLGKMHCYSFRLYLILLSRVNLRVLNFSTSCPHCNATLGSAN